MPRWLNVILDGLQNSPIGEAVRGTPFLYPTLESLHILGIAVLIGPAFALDLRLLGLGRAVLAVTTAARYLLPVSHIGLIVSVATGVVLLSAQATAVAGSAAAPWKFGLLLLASLNVMVFHRGVYRSVAQWTDAVVAPRAARAAASVSLISWTGVLFAGRFLAYV